MQNLAQTIVRTEVRAARIEGMLQADPVLAGLWRTEIAILEAVASVGLEDVRISEGDLLLRISESRSAGADVRAIEDALAILRVLRLPGDPMRDPERVLVRIWEGAMRSDGSGFEAPFRPEEAAGLFSGLEGAMPILDALRVAGRFALLSGRQSPVAERLVFMTAEHAGRSAGNRQGRGDPWRDDDLRGIGGRTEASWIAPPSIGLTRHGFRSWAAGSPTGIATIFQGLDRTLSDEMGRIIAIRRWQERAGAAVSGRHGKSRLKDAIDRMRRVPVVTSAALMQDLGLTRKGALNLIEAMRDHGLIREITARREARIWATPGLAELLGGARSRRAPDRSAEAARRASGAPRGGSDRDGAGGDPGSRFPDAGGAAGQGGLRQRHLRAETQADVERALSDFDEVLKSVDAVLARYGG
jgi:hypothetical protein